MADGIPENNAIRRIIRLLTTSGIADILVFLRLEVVFLDFSTFVAVFCSVLFELVLFELTVGAFLAIFFFFWPGSNGNRSLDIVIIFFLTAKS